VLDVPELAEVDGALVRGQEVEQPLVVRVVEAEQLQQSAIAALRRGEPLADQRAQIVARQIAAHEHRVDVVPEVAAAFGEAVEQLVGHAAAALAHRMRRLAGAAVTFGGSSSVPMRSPSASASICSTTFCSSRRCPASGSARALPSPRRPR
jgi:siroheme synthase